MPLPPVLQERGIAAPGLLAQIIVGKYCDHLPLYRQEQIYKSRHGVELPRQSLARWIELAADWLAPIYRHIREELVGEHGNKRIGARGDKQGGKHIGGYLQVDETPIKYLAPGHGKTLTGYLWTAHRPGGDVLYNWQTSRAADCLEKLIPGEYNGVIQCDGYARIFQPYLFPRWNLQGVTSFFAFHAKIFNQSFFAGCHFIIVQIHATVQCSI